MYFPVMNKQALIDIFVIENFSKKDTLKNEI